MPTYFRVGLRTCSTLLVACQLAHWFWPRFYQLTVCLPLAELELPAPCPQAALPGAAAAPRSPRVVMFRWAGLCGSKQSWRAAQISSQYKAFSASQPHGTLWLSSTPEDNSPWSLGPTYIASLIGAPRWWRALEAILWIDEILHHLRNPGMMIPLHMPTMVSHAMVSKWCNLRQVLRPLSELARSCLPQGVGCPSGVILRKNGSGHRQN